MLKKALEPYLPPTILHRPKMGFAVPLAAGCAAPLAPRSSALWPSPRSPMRACSTRPRSAA